MSLFKDSYPIFLGAIFKYPLNDTTPVRVSCKSMHLASESFNYELDVLRWNTLDGLLNDVVTILIFNTLQNIMLELLHELSLLVG